MERKIDIMFNDGLEPVGSIAKFTERLNAIDKLPIQEQISVLDYILQTVLDDICCSNAARYLYTSKPCGEICIPDYYIDCNNQKHSIIEETVEIELNNCNLYSRPRESNRIIRCLRNISKNGFVFDKNSHFSQYFTDVNLCIVTDNGNHSIRIGKYLNGGKLRSEKHRTELLYDYWNTDGKCWYSKYGNVTINISDFRIAAVFITAQKRNALRRIE